MYVIKRNGLQTPIYFDKITQRNKKLTKDLPHINTESLSQNVIASLKNGMTTHEIDILSCESAFYRSVYEPDYGILASRIAWNDLHKRTPKTFKECIDKLYHNKDIKGNHRPLIHPNVYTFALEHIDRIEKEIDYSLDENFSYPSFKILEQSYLLHVNGEPVERAQSMFMRVALGIHAPSKRNGIIHEGDIEKVIECYRLFSKATHATPTLFNSGTFTPQMSSCFLLSMPDSMADSPYDEDENLIMNPVDEISIPNTIKHMSKISKAAGGIGVDLTRLRCRGSKISGTNGRSTGIIPPMTLLNRLGKYVNQGGKRNGAIAIFCDLFHPDIPEMLEVRLKSTPSDMKAEDIFPALWIPDLFFKRLEEDSVWSFFCPHSHPELITLYGDDFEKRYLELESEGKMVRQLKASELWNKIYTSLDETGLPYMMSKDAVNKKSNHRCVDDNMKDIETRTITSSNLCCEIVQYHDPGSIAVCNLASVLLPVFTQEYTYDFDRLGNTVMKLVENLNYVIDKNYYPVKECAINNFDYRPMGIGVQGLSDVFQHYLFAWGDENAMILDRLIFEHMYFYALKKSCELAKEKGAYPKFKGSPASKGVLQYHMWSHSNPRNPSDPKNGTVIVPYTHVDNNEGVKFLGRDVPKLDWEGLIQDIKTYGLRNSLLIAIMPTVSTASIFGNSDGVDPLSSNVFVKKMKSGDFPLINRNLYKQLNKLGMWNKKTVDTIIRDDGSVKNLNIPQHLKNVFKTVWEISQQIVIDAAANRGPFVDQTQSMNIYLERPTKSKITTMYLYSWKKGLKTLSYYLRSKPASNPIKFSIEENNKEEKKEEKKMEYICNDDVCMSCSS